VYRTKGSAAGAAAALRNRPTVHFGVPGTRVLTGVIPVMMAGPI